LERMASLVRMNGLLWARELLVRAKSQRETVQPLTLSTFTRAKVMTLEATLFNIDKPHLGSELFDRVLYPVVKELPDLTNHFGIVLVQELAPAVPFRDGWPDARRLPESGIAK